MADLTVQQIDEDGFDLSGQLSAASAADVTVPFAGGLMFAMENTDVGAHTFTITAPVSEQATKFGDLPVTDLVITVPASETHVFTVPSGYSQSGVLTWAYDDVTGVAIGVFTLG